MEQSEPEIVSPIPRSFHYSSGVSIEQSETTFSELRSAVLKAGPVYSKVYIELLSMLREAFVLSIREPFVAIPCLKEFYARIGEFPCGPLCKLWLPSSIEFFAKYLLQVAKSLTCMHIHEVPKQDWYICEPTRSEFHLRMSELRPSYIIVDVEGDRQIAKGDALMKEMDGVYRTVYSSEVHWVFAYSQGTKVLFIMPGGVGDFKPAQYRCKVFGWENEVEGIDLQPKWGTNKSLGLQDFCSIFGWNIGLNTVLVGNHHRLYAMPGSCGCSRRYMRWEAETLNFIANQGNLYRAIAKLTNDTTLRGSCQSIATHCMSDGMEEEYWTDVILRMNTTASFDIFRQKISFSNMEEWCCMRGKMQWADLEDHHFVGEVVRSSLPQVLEHVSSCFQHVQNFASGEVDARNATMMLVSTRKDMRVDKKLLERKRAADGLTDTYPKELAGWGGQVVEHLMHMASYNPYAEDRLSTDIPWKQLK